MRALGFAALTCSVLAASCASASFEDPADAGEVVTDSADPITPKPDAGQEIRDALPEDMGFLINRTSLAPAASAGESDDHKLRGGLRSNHPGAATSDQFKLRGRFVPLSP